ncbi:MAG TPA: peptidoglycan DD-metalloendopeptidase family protein [Thermodesulfobacteriota bacterium]|nr:peptidoglycan DD-metalloendopeptidase family protein [Thermodesulfobacteriota bacterium]
MSEKDIEKCLTGKLTVREGYRYHMLEQGETLYRVAIMYGTTVEELISVNNIADYTDIPAGTMLRILGAVISSELVWPLPGKISSGYGRRGSRYHWGIDIPAPNGTPIRAAADGLVLISSDGMNGFSGYGRIVIIEHGKGISTLYAHNSRNDVKPGTCVRAGETIAEVGATGNATGSHLHFEVRKNGKPVNPLNYLP